MESSFGKLLVCKELTGVLEVHIVAIEGILQAVRHDLQLHYLLPYRHVRLRNVDFHFGVVDLAREAVAHHLGEIPGTHGHTRDEQWHSKG